MSRIRESRKSFVTGKLIETGAWIAEIGDSDNPWAGYFSRDAGRQKSERRGGSPGMGARGSRNPRAKSDEIVEAVVPVTDNASPRTPEFEVAAALAGPEPPTYTHSILVEISHAICGLAPTPREHDSSRSNMAFRANHCVEYYTCRGNTASLWASHVVGVSPPERRAKFHEAGFWLAQNHQGALTRPACCCQLPEV